MPTGYTADVADGKVTDLRTFALICARQFGACIMQRDDPSDEPPKFQQPSDYHAKKITEAKVRQAELAAMTLDDAALAAAAEYERALAGHREYQQRRDETRNRYNALLADVIAWHPPTPEHDGLRSFMIEQLTQSRQFDCDYHPAPPVPKSAAAWLAEQREKAARDLDYHTREDGEERRRTEGRNAWIRALYDGLPAPIPPGQPALAMPNAPSGGSPAEG